MAASGTSSSASSSSSSSQQTRQGPVYEARSRPACGSSARADAPSLARLPLGVKDPLSRGATSTLSQACGLCWPPPGPHVPTVPFGGDSQGLARGQSCPRQAEPPGSPSWPIGPGWEDEALWRGGQAGKCRQGPSPRPPLQSLSLCRDASGCQAAGVEGEWPPGLFCLPSLCCGPGLAWPAGVCAARSSRADAAGVTSCRGRLGSVQKWPFLLPLSERVPGCPPTPPASDVTPRAGSLQAQSWFPVKEKNAAPELHWRRLRLWINVSMCVCGTHDEHLIFQV